MTFHILLLLAGIVGLAMAQPQPCARNGQFPCVWKWVACNNPPGPQIGNPVDFYVSPADPTTGLGGGLVAVGVSGAEDPQGTKRLTVNITGVIDEDIVGALDGLTTQVLQSGSQVQLSNCDSSGASCYNVGVGPGPISLIPPLALIWVDPTTQSFAQYQYYYYDKFNTLVMCLNAAGVDLPTGI